MNKNPNGSYWIPQKQCATSQLPLSSGKDHQTTKRTRLLQEWGEEGKSETGYRKRQQKRGSSCQLGLFSSYGGPDLPEVEGKNTNFSVQGKKKMQAMSPKLFLSNISLFNKLMFLRGHCFNRTQFTASSLKGSQEEKRFFDSTL